jgi:predicted PurR-regulated permease PerM
MNRLRDVVYSSILLALGGWLLVIGKNVLFPVVAGAAVVYVFVGLTHTLRKLSFRGHVLPLRLSYLLALTCIGLALSFIFYLVAANFEQILLRAPAYQQSLLVGIQKLAVLVGIEDEPTWTTLRQDFLSQINLQSLLGSMVISVSSLLWAIVVVMLYATFLLVEMRSFPAKVDAIMNSDGGGERVRQIGQRINGRIGSYLALKTIISVLLGGLSWAIMAHYGLEFAPFWAMLIGLLNFIPYIGSFLGVLLPLAMGIAQFQDPGIIVPMMLALSLVQFGIGNFLDPYLMGNSLNLSPLAILISLAVWSDLWGIAGAFLAVPITAVIAIICSEFSSTRPVAVLLSQNGRV